MSDPQATVSAVGAQLQYWRKARRLSQLALATEAEISSRHLCFVETGRARPSREMVLLLASVLDVPLRDRNELLLAAGFAPAYPESPLDAPAMASVRTALDAMLRQNEPYPAVVMNRRWDLVRVNDAARRFFAHLLEGCTPARSDNVLHLMLDPEAVRPFVANWPDVADSLVRRAQRECVGGIPDESTRALLGEIRRYPDVASRLGGAPSNAPLPIVPVSFAKDGRRFDYFSAITTLGTPQDVTAQEIRIECFYPVDAATERAARAFA